MTRQVFAAVFIALLGVSVFAQTIERAEVRPNILLVVVDDAGFMDFGAYGSDTSTPTIDALGASGSKFTHYYTTPLCGPSRAALLTGMSAHQVGAATLAEVLTDEMRVRPAYSMRWADSQQTIASRLKSAGYQTFVSGKWGVGDIGANLPNRFGFDRSWVLDSTGASNFRAKSYLPHYLDVKWYEDGELTSLPEDFYSSRNIVDKMIQFLKEGDASKPFFGFVSFQAIHIPLQVPREFIDKYDGVFDRGWDVMRRERFNKAVSLGLIPATAKFPKEPPDARPWESLTEEEKRFWARSMQVNSGMMESADYHLGRLIEHLRQSNQLENTVIIVTSDNGPEYNTLGKTSKPAVRAFENFWMMIEGWDVTFENLGQVGSLAAIGHEWASVSAAPFHLFKFTASEGGTRVPLVVAGPKIAARGFLDARAQVSDLTPTLLDFAGVSYRTDEFYGRSLKPVLTEQVTQVYGDNDSFVFEVSGAAALYRGNWKLTKTPPPLGDGEWRLFNLAVDPGEVDDVAAQQPALYQEMLEEYKAYAGDVGIFELPPGEGARKQLVINAVTGTLKNYWWLFGGIAVLLIGLLWLLVAGAMFSLRRLRTSST